MKFSKGDVVCLKSGGPEMTVKEINEQGYKCSWFVKDTNSFSTANFCEEELESKDDVDIRKAEALNYIGRRLTGL